jgi:ankyrin repeat protein
VGSGPRSAATADSECVVKDFSVNGQMENLLAPAVPIAVRRVSHPPPNANFGTGAPTASTSNPEPARDEAEAIRRAVARRDLTAFLRVLPADPARRQDALRKSAALDDAFRNCALAIVRQILRSQPDALASERFPNSNRIAVAAVASEWNSLQYFERQGVPIDNRPDDNDYPELLRILLKADATPNGNHDGVTPLAIIAALPPTPATIEAARLLLDAGASIGAPSPGEAPPLVAAAESSNGEVLRMMLATRHPDQELLDAALVRTAITGTNSALPLLLEAGANINTSLSPAGDPRNLFTPALRAASRFKFEGERNVMQLMIRYRANPNRLAVTGIDSPLTLVTPDVELMTGLLDLGADADYLGVSGNTALVLAVTAPAASAPAGPSARYASIAVLLKHGADASKEDGFGVSPLKATRAGDTAVVSLLMEHGATWRLNDRDLSYSKQYQVPIGRYSWAVLQQKDALAAAMLAHKEPLSPDDCGIVYYAAASGSDATLATLLDQHLGSYAVRADNLTPLMAAVAHGQLGAVRLLLDHHVANVEERTPRRVGLVGHGHGPPAPALVGALRPLMFAGSMNSAAVAEELIRRGAEVNARDFGGYTALHYAQIADADAVIAVLQAHGATN